MEHFEEAVMWYLAAGGKRFVAPQYSIPAPDGKEWSCPDFIVLDIEKRIVFVVEVSTHANPVGLARKVLDRKKQWIDPLKEHLKGINQELGSWKYQAVVFLRSEAVERFDRRIGTPNDVAVISIEDTCFAWKWEWQGMRPNTPLERAALLHGSSAA
jgi:hypothetical protein